MKDKYEEIIANIWKLEREKIKKDIKNNKIPNYFYEKLHKLIGRTSLSQNIYQEAVDKIKKGDELLITFLMKDPKRQNVYENVLLNSLREKGIDIKKLPSSGQKAMFLHLDEVKYNFNKKPKELKSLDFEIQVNGKTIYIVHKYTNEEGGAQDNQYNDVITQMRNLGPKTIKNVWFCLDGRYYTKKRKDELKKINENAVIVNIDNIMDFLINFFKK